MTCLGEFHNSAQQSIPSSLRTLGLAAEATKGEHSPLWSHVCQVPITHLALGTGILSLKECNVWWGKMADGIRSLIPSVVSIPREGVNTLWSYQGWAALSETDLQGVALGS